MRDGRCYGNLSAVRCNIVISNGLRRQKYKNYEFCPADSEILAEIVNIYGDSR